MFADRKVKSDPLKRRVRRLTRGERREEAGAFIDLFYRENGLAESRARARKREVAAALTRDGWYEHTPEELAFGARVAWRNSARCVGRLFWKSLEVVDCRAATDPDQVAAHLLAHMRRAHEGDRVRSIISIFPPIRGARSPTYVENRQLVQYAGYVEPEGGVRGDPVSIELTRTALALGWSPKMPPGCFDVLPLILRAPDGERKSYELPEDCLRHVPLTHPRCMGFEALQLRWYAVPFVSDMILTIGGLDYPCAPFNGHYMATEIASRNLTDPYRYNLLEAVADALDLDRTDPLWRDDALTELNRAVLHSFNQGRVSICDHHTASDWYITFVQNELAAGRDPSGSWSWIVPPQASSASAVFHLPMQDHHDVPNFYRSRAVDGGRLAPNRSSEMRSRWAVRADQGKRRVRSWLRERMW